MDCPELHHGFVDKSECTVKVPSLNSPEQSQLDSIATFQYFNNMFLIVSSDRVNIAGLGREGGRMSVSIIIEIASYSVNVDKSKVLLISLKISSSSAARTSGSDSRCNIWFAAATSPFIILITFRRH
jgi:hypothetical protein